LNRINRVLWLFGAILLSCQIGIITVNLIIDGADLVTIISIVALGCSAFLCGFGLGLLLATRKFTKVYGEAVTIINRQQKVTEEMYAVCVRMAQEFEAPPSTPGNIPLPRTSRH